MDDESTSILTGARELILPDESATLALGASLAEVLKPPALVFLQGELGAGKTTLVRGLLRAWGYHGAVKSPTYTLVEPYDLGGIHLHHFDLYRLAGGEELEAMGIRDYFTATAVSLVEWPRRGGEGLGQPDLTISLKFAGDGRVAQLQAKAAAITAALACRLDLK